METLTSLVRVLSIQPFLQGMDEGYLEALAGCAAGVSFEAGQTIFREGDRADAFYLIQRGKVAIEVHAPERGTVTIQTLGEGDVLGWSWLFPPYRWHFDARAMQPTRAIALNAACLRGKIENDPALGYEMMRRVAQTMVQRLQATRLQLLDVYGHARST